MRATVETILADIEKRGDSAVLDLSRKFDNWDREDFRLSQSEIDFYINHYKPFDKAGAYGIQEWIGMIGIEKIEGSYFNVMGLPIHRVYEKLSKYFA